MAEVLGKFGIEARASVPAWLNRLDDAGSYERFAATNALGKITPQALTNAPKTTHVPGP